MKKINLTPECEKTLIQIADAAERNLSTRVFSPLWEKIIKEIVDQPEKENDEKA